MGHEKKFLMIKGAQTKLEGMKKKIQKIQKIWAFHKNI